MGDGSSFDHVHLDQDDVAYLQKIAADLPILADLCRADLLLYCDVGGGQATTVAQARPHSFSSLYEEQRVGVRVTKSRQFGPLAVAGLWLNRVPVRTVTVNGVTVARQLWPVRNAHGRRVATLTIDAFWLAHERHRRRSRSFQEALTQFVGTVLRGELRCADELSHFGEHDGIMFVRSDRRIGYMSGIASELYRHLGYRDSLVGRSVSEVDTVDSSLVVQTASDRDCLEVEVEQDGLTWTRKALPITTRDDRLVRRVGLGRLPSGAESLYFGSFILVHDSTPALKTKRELESKMALVREVHHRVKNNLQVIASIMRMQARRVQSDEAREVLEESVNRVLSVAVVHEFLSRNAQGSINLLDIARRILSQVEQGLIDPSKRIGLSIEGPDVWLPAERATQCALVINELVQNAIEHGLVSRAEGRVEVALVDDGDRVTIVVEDNGVGLPDGFDIKANANLGLNIVKSMVERDLRGRFGLKGTTAGTRATVEFGKALQ